MTMTAFERFYKTCGFSYSKDAPVDITEKKYYKRIQICKHLPQVVLLRLRAVAVACRCVALQVDQRIVRNIQYLNRSLYL